MTRPSSRAEEILILVESIHAALRCERELQARGIACDLIPVPRELRSDCGMCLSLAPAEFARAAPVLLLLRRQASPKAPAPGRSAASHGAAGRDGAADSGFAAFRRTASGFVPAPIVETGTGA